MKKSILLLSGAVAFSLDVSAATVVNGSFEADSWYPYVYELETAGVTGWTALDPNVTTYYPWGIHDASYGETPFGDQFVVLGNGGLDAGTSIQQTLTGLTPGGIYQLDFWISSEGYTAFPGGGNANVRVAMVSGSTTPSADYAAPFSVATYWDTWALNSYIFEANSTTATFAFEDLAGTGYGYDIGIDNVSVTDIGEPVPEPGAIFGGLALGALVLRRTLRRK